MADTAPSLDFCLERLEDILAMAIAVRVELAGLPERPPYLGLDQALEHDDDFKRVACQMGEAMKALEGRVDDSTWRAILEVQACSFQMALCGAGVGYRVGSMVTGRSR